LDWLLIAKSSNTKTLHSSGMYLGSNLGMQMALSSRVSIPSEISHIMGFVFISIAVKHQVTFRLSGVFTENGNNGGFPPTPQEKKCS